MNCVYCNEPVDPDARTTWHLIVGWERRAQKGSSRRGGSDVALRQRRDKLACDRCVRRLKRRIAPTQGELL